MKQVSLDSPEPFLPTGMTFPDILTTLGDEGYGDAEPKNESDVFIRDCLDWLATWFERNAESAITQAVMPFMFVFDSTLMTKNLLPGTKSLPAFRKAMETHIGGHIYACATNLRQVFGASTGLTTCSQLLGHLVEANLSTATAVAVSPQGQFALVHCGGDPEDAYRVSFERVSRRDFDFSELDVYLTEFYETHLSTHEGFCDIWAKAKDRRLKDFAERQIQKTLQAFFHYGVLSKAAKIYREIQTYAGREDLRIIRAKADRTLEGALMELKVLRPTDTEAANLDWAKKGVDQAASYAETDDMTTHRYVCCYDARKSDTAMPDGVTYAKSKSIAWRRYFLQTPGCSRTTSVFDS